MAKYVRRIDKKTWLTDDTKTKPDRIESGITEFEDPEGEPSVYCADTPKQLLNAMAALAWDRRQRNVEKISRTRYVIVTDEHLAKARLDLSPEETPIPWRCLRKAHRVIVAGDLPCTPDDLRRLVTVLIDSNAEHSEIPGSLLKKAAARQTAFNTPLAALLSYPRRAIRWFTDLLWSRPKSR